MPLRYFALFAGAALSTDIALVMAQPQVAVPEPRRIQFHERPGQLERSGRLLVRPVQESGWMLRGFTRNDARSRMAIARAMLDPVRVSVLLDTDIHVVAVTAGNTEESVAQTLMDSGLFEFAEPDWIAYPAAGPETNPDDPIVRAEWHLQKIKAPTAWNAFTGNGSIVCAFVDTGVDLTHPDLAPLLIPGFNSVTRTTQGAGGLVSDINGHGTSVAGVAAAMGNNGIGGSGITWTSRIMPIRATNYASGAAFMSDILYGASWAAFNGAKVVSVSYAGVENSSVEPTGAVIRQSYGGLLLWAAGNNSANLSGFDHPSTTVVGSTDPNDIRAWDSNYGRAIDVMAPGVNMYVPVMGGGTAILNGTSFATPVAAGVLALAWSAAPTMTPDQAMNVLYQSCDALEPVTEFNNTGWGRVNASRAVQLATGGTPKNPLSLRAIADPGRTVNGLIGRYYPVSGATSLPMFGGTPAATAAFDSISCHPGSIGAFVGNPFPGSFGLTLDGFITIPITGVYTLTLNSKDGSRVLIDGIKVADNDGIHAQSFRSGTVRLEKGLHKIHCDYFSSGQQPSLVMSIRGEGLGEIVAPASMFRRPTRLTQPVGSE